MGIETEGVKGPESQPGETNDNPEVHQDDGAGSGTGKDENRIPQSRVEEMWAKREAKLRQEWQEKELNPIRKQFEDHQNRLTQAELARLKAMGWLKDEAPKPVTQDELDKYVSEKLDKARNEDREERLQFHYQQVINNGWREAGRKYPELVKMKSYQNSVLAIFAENPQADFVDVADMVAKDYDAYYASRETAAAKERESRRSPANRVVPGGRGAAGGSRADEGKNKRSVAQKIADRIKAAKEGNG